jgi:anti-sigma regulatory factor (Ser/Thr protein kinase)
VATCKVEFELNNNISELAKLHAHLDALRHQSGQSQRNCLELNLVLEEIVTNIINHGFKDDAQHRIQVSITLDGNILTVRTIDDGRPFNPINAQRPKLNGKVEKRPVGGLGLVLIRRYSDDISYERRGKQNVLTIRKKFA